MNIAEPLRIAIDEFNKFPGIGRKTAQRLVLHLLKSGDDDFLRFITALNNLKEKLRYCAECFNISEDELCPVCSSDKRDRGTICVVEEASDVMAIEKTHEYGGLYHVLGGVLSPLSGIGPEHLKIKELLSRIAMGAVAEVIVALNPDTEGEATALYLQRLLKPLNVQVSRIARGLPVGGDLEFADDATIGKAVAARVAML